MLDLAQIHSQAKVLGRAGQAFQMSIQEKNPRLRPPQHRLEQLKIGLSAARTRAFSKHSSVFFIGVGIPHHPTAHAVGRPAVCRSTTTVRMATLN